MIDRPEQLTLLGDDSGQTRSAIIPTSCPSRPRTRRSLSEDETPTTPSEDQTAAQTLVDADEEAVLRRAAEAATAAAVAQQQLDEAVDAARRAGASWRAIARATGVPFHTLHSRRRAPVGWGRQAAGSRADAG
jgi:hypothetical protein